MAFSLRPASFASLHQHRWLRLTFYALAALILVWLISWLALPPLLKGPLERLASERLGRSVKVGAIDFKPWSLELALRDVAVAGADGAPPQLTIARIYADGELQSVLRMAPVVDAFTIDAPALRLTHLADGRYDVDDILARLTAPSDKPGSGPARLALYNLALTGGSIDFVDKTIGETHEVRELALQVPFISTLPSEREVKVQPHLSFALDGSRFDSSAEATPFAQTGQGDAQLRFEGLNLAPYLAYLPATLPVRVRGATLDADVKLAFEQKPRMAVRLTGTLQASGVRVADRQGAELLSYDRLKVDMADVRPLEHVVRLQHVELTAPVLSARRDAAGHINLLQLAPTATTAPAAPTARVRPAAPVAPPASGASASAPAPPASAATAAPAPASAAWTVEVATAAVRGGTLRWSDQSTQPAAALRATGFTLDAADVALPFAKPFTFKGALRLDDSALNFSGQATDRQAQLNATLQGLALQLAAPYLAQALEPTVAGRLTGEIGVQWVAPAPQAAQAGATGVTFTAGPLALEQLAVQQGKTTLASLGRMELQGAQVPLDARTVTLEKVTLAQPRTTVERGADGRWMFERWSPGSSTKAPARAVPPEAAATWKVRVADFAVQGGSVAFTDRTQPRPVALDLSELNISARNLASDGSKPEAFSLSARAAASAKGRSGSAPGQLDYQGTLALQPLAAQGRLAATRLPLHALDGYLANRLAIELQRADVGYRGQVAVAQTAQGVSLRLNGDALIEDLQAHSTAASTAKTEAQVGQELLAWKSLNLRGLAVNATPGAAPRVEVKETSLVDFFARITVNEAGRINLSDIAKSPAEAQAANAASAAGAAANAAPPAAAEPVASALPSAAAAPAAPAAAVAQADPLAPVVVFGPVSLVNGKVLFSDFFIKPNYSADLSELTGRLGGFSTEVVGGEPVLADLELRGRAEGTASLEVSGKLNPLAKPLALDITGKVRELELPPLTPYAVKYAGHGIQSGKLSMDVNYKVLPSGQLTASNRLVLNQLTFSEPVAGAPNSLPVRLAVALLADSHGVIDLDLPISGSLNDPQFRIGPVIFKIIGNLIRKAITSPFSLLASAFGGDSGGGAANTADMNTVAFAPGSATLTTEAQQQLSRVAKALAERPALKLTVTGMASLEREREGLLRENLQRQVLAEKRRASPGDATPVQAAEYPALLKEVYRRTDLPKPRNLVGLAKDLPVPKMEALLMAHQSATEAMAAELATQRGEAVRAHLVAQNLPAERVALAAPKAGTQPEKWTPRAELSLDRQ